MACKLGLYFFSFLLLFAAQIVMVQSLLSDFGRKGLVAAASITTVLVGVCTIALFFDERYPVGFQVGMTSITSFTMGILVAISSLIASRAKEALVKGIVALASSVFASFVYFGLILYTGISMTSV